MSPNKPHTPLSPHTHTPQAVLLIRAMALALPPPALEDSLRGVYRADVTNARFVSAASLPHLHFMGAAVVEMSGLDLGVTYLAAFSAIRPQAVQQRNPQVQRTQDALREVYSRPGRARGAGPRRWGVGRVGGAGGGCAGRGGGEGGGVDFEPHRDKNE